MILKAMNKPETLIKKVQDRPGHDRRYSLDCSKIANKLGFKPETDFKKALEETVRWYRDNERWWKKLKNSAFEKYYRANYKV